MKNYLPLIVSLGLAFSAATVSAQNRSLPSDGGYVNVKTDFGAVGNGVADDTAAIQAAIRSVLVNNGRYNPRFIYFPNGTYKISDTLISRMADTSGFSQGWRSGMVLYGESTTGTIIRLADNTPGFGSAGTKAMILTGSENPGNADGRGNQGFKHSVLNMTIHTGTGNPGAIGIDYNVSNIGTIERVKIVAGGSGAGRTGLNLTRTPGPGMIKNVTIEGFDIGIDADAFLYSMVFESISLIGQKVAGVRNQEQVLSFRNLFSNNSVPAILTTTPHGLINLIDSEFIGGASGNTAITSTGKLNILNLRSSGYGTVVQNSGGTSPNVSGGSGVTQIDQYSSHGPYTAFSGALTEALNLPVEETPDFHTTNFSNWANVLDYASPQAAIDSGKLIVYFPNGVHKINSTLIVRGNVRKIMGMEAALEKNTGFSGGPLVRFAEGTHPEVIIEHMRIKGTIEHDSSRTLALRHVNIVGSGIANTAAATGKLFIEDVITKKTTVQAPLTVWARQLNTETSTDSILWTNNGATLWILGFKTENQKTAIETKNGGYTELLGALLYLQSGSAPTSIPAFIIDNAHATLSYAVSSNRYPVQVREKRGSVTQELLASVVPDRGSADNCAYFAGYTTPFPTAGSGSIILFDSVADTDYVTANVNLARTWSLSGSTARITFSDANALSPGSGYNGPQFFGAASTTITGTGKTSSNARTNNVQNRAAPLTDRVNVVYNIANSSTAAKTISSGGLILFKSVSPFSVTSPDAFSATLMGSNGFSQVGRWVVRTGSGTYYVSNETFTVGSLQTSSAVNTTTWAVLNTGASNYYRNYGTFAPLSLTGLTGAGIYYEGQRTGVTSTGNAGTGFRLDQFQVIP